MSATQVYPSFPGHVEQDALSDVSSNVGNGDWYTPGPYPYGDPYMTPPYAASTIEAQPWGACPKASMPEIPVSTYSGPQAPNALPAQVRASSQPRSSPGCYSPTPEHAQWPTSNGLGIYSACSPGQPQAVTSSYPPSVFQPCPVEEHYSTSTTSSPGEIKPPRSRRSYTNIAPNPTGASAIKRKAADDDDTPTDSDAGTGGKRRKRTTSSVVSADLGDDDRFLVQLKEEQNLPWKDIAARFQSDKGKGFQVAALQMRYKRLREKFRVWQEQDVSALKLAHEYWEKYKWEIISAKMLDFGVQERWPARHCARKWQDMEAATATMAATAHMTPAMSHFSSPVPADAHYAFMPLH